ncbi:MAG: cell division protein FtsA [Patescibacteria group bacterium]
MRNNLSVGIDIGTTKVITCIGKFENGITDIIGLGSSLNQGIRRGVIVDVEETVSAISASLVEAEKMSGMKVANAFVGISGAHIQSEDTKGVIAVSKADGEIGEVDVEKVIESTKTTPSQPNREILHVIPRYFIIDGHEEIKDPVGMTGIRLEVIASVISTSTNALKSLTRAVTQAGVSISGLVYSPISTAGLLLSKRQQDIGVVLIDIGAGSTSYSVFEEGDMIISEVIPIGSIHITNDIAIGLRTNIDLADLIKLKYGYAIPDKIDEKEEIDLRKLDKNEEGTANVKYISEIIEARLNEILMIVKERLTRIDRDGALPAGVVLTGGGAKIEGVVELTKSTMHLPAQVGRPILEISGLIDKLDDPVYATAIGLMLWGKNKNEGGSSFDFDIPGMGGFIDKTRNFFRHFLP